MKPEIVPETILGERFRLVSRRERGWRGDFFTAEDSQRDGQTADIEVMRAGGRQEEQLERLVRREVDIGDWLNDIPRVLRALAWGRHESGWLWVAREWVTDAKPFDPTQGSVNERIERLLDAAEAVSGLSARGIVHRDLGAQSILVAESGIHLARFGLAKLDEVSDPWAGPTGLPFLHLRCVAAEAFDRPGGADERADVYALGVLLFRALSGRWPFPGPSLPQLVGQQLRVQMGKRDLPKASARASVPEELDSLCERALQPDPGLRLKTVGDFMTALDEYLASSDGSAVAAPPRRKTAAIGAPVKPVPEPVFDEPESSPEPAAPEISFESPEPAAAEVSFEAPSPEPEGGVEISGLDFGSDEGLIPEPAAGGTIEDLDPSNLDLDLDLGALDLGGAGEMLDVLDLTAEPESAPVDASSAPGPAPVPEGGDAFADDFGSDEDLAAVALPADPEPVADDDPFVGDDFMAATSGSDVGDMMEEDPFAESQAGVDTAELSQPDAAASNPFGSTDLEEDATDEFNVMLAPPSAGGLPAAPAMPELSEEDLLPPSAFDEFEVERGTLLAAIDIEELQELVENLNQLDPKGLHYLLLDMSKVENLGTTELEALTQVSHVARRRKLQAGMFGVTRGVRHVLQLMDMSDQVPFLLSADDRKDALMEIASLG
jgi:serine/threonine-protein kinase